MKHQYLNAVFTNLILERDYEPVKAIDTTIQSEIMFLQKYGNGICFLVELIDADLLSAEAIEAKLKADYKLLIENDNNQILHLITVLVFNSNPSPDKLSAINNGLQIKNIAKKYLSCFTVDLTGQTVVRQSKNSVGTGGVEKVLKTYVKETNVDYEVLPDINRLMMLRKKEYSIELKAEKSTLTYALIGINIAVFLVFNAYSAWYGQSYGSMLGTFGAKDNMRIINGEYWRLISPVFLHANLFHLLINCYSLYIVGDIVEKIYGHFKFGLLYFLAGIYGSVASFIFTINPAVGASGAIFGLLGALAYYGVEKPKIFKKYFGYNVALTIIINIVIGFSMAGIDNFAHLGGLTGGFLTAHAVKVNPDPSKTGTRILALIAVLLIVYIGFYYGLHRVRM